MGVGAPQGCVTVRGANVRHDFRAFGEMDHVGHSSISHADRFGERENHILRRAVVMEPCQKRQSGSADAQITYNRKRVVTPGYLARHAVNSPAESFEP